MANSDSLERNVGHCGDVRRRMRSPRWRLKWGLDQMRVYRWKRLNGGTDQWERASTIAFLDGYVSRLSDSITAVTLLFKLACMVEVDTRRTMCVEESWG
jgi:hypothetical protein